MQYAKGGKGYGTYIPFEHATFGCQGGREGEKTKENTKNR